jgi:hypothetical protein
VRDWCRRIHRRNKTGEECPVTIQTVDQEDYSTAIEVRVYRHGDLVHTESCNSMSEAWLVVDDWAGTDQVTFEVGDLLVRRREGE